MIRSFPRVRAVRRSPGLSGTGVLLAAFACSLFVGSPLAADFRPVAIQGGTVLTGDGGVIEGGTVLVRGNKIAAVGPDVGVSVLARKVSASGKFVTPGLVDAYSTLALRYALSGDQAPARASEAFDRYADDEILAALRSGITTIYVPARSGTGIGGRGAVIRLNSGDEFESVVLDDEAALSAVIVADGRQPPLARLKAAEGLRKRFQAARDYRQAWEDYDESLKEYEKKLAERAATQDKDKDAKKPPSKKRERREKGAAPAKRDTPKPDKPAENDEKKPADKKKEELKKPAEPKKDRNAEELLRVLDGQLRLRVEAHHPADILNALEIADDFNIALILEGGTGAHLVADRLAEAEVPVVLWAEPAPVSFLSDVRRDTRPDDAAILSAAGVDVYFGSGVLPEPGATPQLALRASRAVGYGFDPDAALQALTDGAARLLGVEKRIGRVQTGLEADLVIWSDHPFAPGAQVERVFIAGEEVYNADAGRKGHDE